MGRNASVGVVLGLLLATGCVPSRESRSAGQVGCSPDEISISDEQTQFGLLQSGETWTAECHGRTFICTQMNNAGNKDDALGSLLTSEQVACTEEAESPQEERNREARNASHAAALAPKPPTPPPTGAAGFELGQSLDDAQKRCEAAGKQWTPGVGETPTCSGAVADIGIPAQLGLRFCGGRECAISIEHRPTVDWSRSVVALKTQLEAKYGPPRETAGPIPDTCRSPESFTQCLDANRLTLRYAWRWASGEGVEMLVGKPSTDMPPSIRLIYTRASGAANVSAL